MMIGKLRKLAAAIKVAKAYYKFGGFVKPIIAYCDNSNQLAGKNILITGGTSGIGLEIARKCLKGGAKVVITGRNRTKLEDALASLDNKNCFGVIWDISKVGEVETKVKECGSLIDGEINVLVNNAGIAPSRFWGNTDEEEWDKIYSTNLKGMFFLTQTLVRIWNNNKNSEYRKILNISSQGGFVGATYPYRMVKWDIRGFTEGLAKELISCNIIVNGIAPGVVKTSMQQFSLEQGDNLFTSQNPIHRICLPEEIAELANFLISDASNFIIGQTIVCDGGFTLK